CSGSCDSSLSCDSSCCENVGAGLLESPLFGVCLKLEGSRFSVEPLSVHARFHPLITFIALSVALLIREGVAGGIDWFLGVGSNGISKGS
ncbi:unnamed protein product, partial [Mycena citricolor]